MLKIFLPVLSVILALVMSSCTSVTKQSKKTTILDASQEDTLGGTGTSSADIRSMAERMAREIAALSFPVDPSLPQGVPPSRVRIALTDIENETRFPIKPNVIKRRLLADLVEFSANTKVEFTENPERAHYILSALITSLSKGSSEGVSDYLLYSFKMEDRTDTVKWMGTYETKKQGNVGVMYR